MQYLDEIVVLGGTAVALALIFKGDYVSGFATFTAVLGYAAGRTQKLNGAMAAALTAKKK